MQEITLPKSTSGSSNQVNGSVNQNTTNTTNSNAGVKPVSDDNSQIPYGSNPSSKSKDFGDNIVNLPKVTTKDPNTVNDSDSNKSTISNITNQVVSDSNSDIKPSPDENDHNNNRKDLVANLRDPSVHSKSTTADDQTQNNTAQISFNNFDDNSTAKPVDTHSQVQNTVTDDTPNDSDDESDDDLFGDFVSANPISTTQNNNQSTQSASPFKSLNPTITPKQRSTPTQRPPQFAPPIQNDPWGDPWGMDSFGGGVGGGSTFPANPAPQLSPKERVDMIENVYQRVLKRKPDTRDINYYKYSTLGEDEITAQLLDGKEHTQLVENGREYKTVLRRAEDAEIKIKQIDATMADQLEEYRHLTDLLKEKNKIIVELRNQLRNPYNINSPKPPIPMPVSQEPSQETPPPTTAEPPLPTTTKDIFFTDQEDLAKKNDLLATQYLQIIPNNEDLSKISTDQSPTEVVPPVETGYRYQERPDPRYQFKVNNDTNQFPSMGDDRPETLVSYEVPEIENSSMPYKNNSPSPIMDGNFSNSDHQQSFQNQEQSKSKDLPVESYDQVPKTDEQTTFPASEVDLSNESEKTQDKSSHNEQSETPANSMDRDEKIGFFDLSLEEAFKTIQKPSKPESDRNKNNSSVQNPDDYSVPPVYGASVNNQSSGNFVFTGTSNDYQSEDNTNENSSGGLFGKLKDIIKP